MIELLFVTLGVMVAFFIIIGGVFWSWGFITSAFDGAFTRFEEDMTSPFTFSPPPPPDKGEEGWEGANYMWPIGFEGTARKKSNDDD